MSNTVKKICRLCGKEKDIKEFNFRKDNNKYRNDCKECQAIRNKEYRIKNSSKIRQQRKNYYENNKEQINKLKRIKYKTYYEENKEAIKEKRRLDYSLDKNQQHYKKKIYHEKRKISDKLYAFKKEIRSLIINSLKRNGYKKESKTCLILGENYNIVFSYLKKTFIENYGYEWDGIEKVHIDHIIPLASAKTEEEVIKLCNYKNLQLLKEKDNLEKGSKLNWKLEKENEREIIKNSNRIEST